MNVSMKHMLRRDEGFALPTILIASVIMLTVLMSAITAVSSITGGLNSQYYNQLAREAAESGLSYAETCLRASSYNPTWTDAAPLQPDMSCTGVSLGGGYSKWVTTTANFRTTFVVKRPQVGVASSLTIVSMGTVELTRTSDVNAVWRTYTVTVGKSSRYNDTPQIASGAGWKDPSIAGYAGHNGYMLTGSGILYGWGDNSEFQLGDASIGTPILKPIKIALPSGVTRTKRVFNSGQGASVLCILATHNTIGDQVYCRGDGLGLTGSAWQRIILSSGLTAMDAVVNGYGTDGICVKASDLQAYCAGENYAGNLGDGTTTAGFVPVTAPVKFRLDLANPAPPAGTTLPLTVKKVFTQDIMTCVIASDDRAYCAGINNITQLGQGTATTNVWIGKSIPGRSLVPGDPSIVDIRMPYHGGNDGIFYQSNPGDIFMSGHNALGTANDGAFGAAAGACALVPWASANCYAIPRQLTSGAFGKMISVGERGDDNQHGFCVIAAGVYPDSGLWCMGSNTYGQLGIACTRRPSWGLVPVLNTGGVSQSVNYLMNVEANYQINSLMVITVGGDVYAAGDNTYGKLGTGTPLTSCNSTFKRVLLPAGVKGVAVANGDEYSSFILGDNGKVYGMGRNNTGQLGDGTTTDRSTPVEVQIPRQETIF